jgi:hypothetical protein
MSLHIRGLDSSRVLAMDNSSAARFASSSPIEYENFDGSVRW